MAAPVHDRLDALTSLRFFAALHVVFYHGGLRLLRGAPRWAENVRSCGYASVSFFFVLSGFILTYNYVDPERPEPFRVRQFFVARLSRIYPIYLVALLFLTAVSLKIFGSPFIFTQVESGLASVLLAQAWFPSYAMAWNFPGWSISAEAFFYLVFPLAAAVLRRKLEPRLLALLVTLAWIASLSVSAGYLVFDFDEDAVRGPGSASYWFNVLSYHPLARLPEFLVGMGLGRLFVGERAAGKRRDGTWMAAVGLGGALLLFAGSSSIPEPLLRVALPVPFFALLIYGCARGAHGFDRVLSNRPIVTLGDASYSLYILQLPLVIAMLTALGKPPMFRDMSGPLFLGYVAALIALSLLTFRFVERPMQHALRRWFSA